MKLKTSPIRKAVIINASGRYLKIILGVVINAVLARILTPFDFGVVAVISVFSAFFATLSDLGLSAAIVQKKELTQTHINSLFTYSVYVSVFFCLIFLGCAVPISRFYGDSIYLKPTLLLSISLLFSSLDMIPNGLLNRDKKFGVLTVRTIIVYLVSSVIAIYLALHGWRFYALVAQSIISSFLIFLCDVIITKPSLIRKPDSSAIDIVKGYSFYQFAFSLVNYFARNLDNLLTGKFMGEENLGQYNKAYSLMLFPINNLSGVISPVLHPILSDYQNEPKEIYARYIKLVRFLFCAGLFIAPFAYLASDEIIGILYGPQWESCATCFRYMSIAIITQMINASAGAIFQAIGNTKLLFISTLFNTAITISAICAGIFIWGDIESLSICIAISYIFHFLIAFYLLIKKGFRYRFTDFILSIRHELAMTVIMVLAVLLFPFQFDNLFVSLASKTAYLGIIYSIMMIVSKEYKLFKLF